jgi:acetylornithine deacetylase/succinyl-diaminopimelate desuccinylase-like protein
MDVSELKRFVNREWDDEIIGRLSDYIRVPAKSPAFDPSWAAHGYLEQVIRDAHEWSAARDIKDLKLEIVNIDGMTPCLFFEVPATGGLGQDDSVLFYGHLDKQPEMEGWREDLGPWKPVLEDGKLYGRGGADDGYAIYAALTIIAALDSQNVPRPRCVGLIETSEESGSPDLPAYLDALGKRMGNVRLVAGLDSGCGNYEQLWVTTSLRGLVGGTLSVQILEEGVHSGMASGIVPSSFRLARQLLNRIDDVNTGRVQIEQMHAAIPEQRLLQAQKTGEILGSSVWDAFPWVGCSHGPEPGMSMMPTTDDPVEAILNRTWRPALSVTGGAGLPRIDEAGNVLRPMTKLKLSMRIAPTVDGEAASAALKDILEKEPPHNARVEFTPDHPASGWNAPETAGWLNRALAEASQQSFGKEPGWIGEGGTIPFMNMLGDYFPDAQFLITGVLGPRSNAHGPNEFLHIEYGKRLTEAVASVVARVG